jgi:hypothetical protein
MGGSNQSQELVAAQTGLVQNRKKRAARNILAVGYDDQADAAAGIPAIESAMAALASVRRFDKSGSPEGADDLP